MQIFKKTLPILLISILNFGLFAVPPIAGANKNSGQVKIRYAAFEGMTGLGFWFGKEKGFFKDAGLDLELLNINDKVAAWLTFSDQMLDRLYKRFQFPDHIKIVTYIDIGFPAQTPAPPYRLGLEETVLLRI